MNIKNFLKKFSLLYNLNVWLKGYSQEYKANKTLLHYKKEAICRNLNILEGNDLVAAFRERLASRGIYPKPKSKDNLHIFCAFSLSNWEYVLPIALKPFGKVISFEWNSLEFGSYSKNSLEKRDNMNNKMLKKLKKEHSKQSIDVLIGYFSSRTISSKALKQISNMGIITFNFSWDDKLHFRNLANIVSLIDLNLTNAPDSCIKYIVEGGFSMFWPEAAHPEIHRPYEIPFEYDVSFVGKRYGWRPRFIDYLRKKGVKIATFGDGWENGTLSNEDAIKLYSKSRINLGFAGVGHSKKLMCLKARDFEIPMSGGLYLTQDNPELSLVYDVGKEIWTYKDKRDCLNKIRWILSHQKEAIQIRNAARKRALQEHTWERRFEEIFRVAGIME